MLIKGTVAINIFTVIAIIYLIFQNIQTLKFTIKFYIFSFFTLCFLLFIFLLFLAIETSPIFSKLIAPKGEYDFKLQDIENAAKTWVSQKENQRANVLNTDTILNEAIYNELADEEELYTYKKQKARKILQFQADAFHKSQKRIVG